MIPPGIYNRWNIRFSLDKNMINLWVLLGGV